MKIYFNKTNSILDKISEQKIREIEILDKNILNLKVEDVKSFDFLGSLKGNNFKLIAEVKKASPSEGEIRKNFDHMSIAKEYEKLGAECLSVLTDEVFFKGSKHILTEIKKVSKLPVLRKDFILHESQVFESKAIGADAILLIVSILDKIQLKDLYEIANEIGLSVLVEIHDENEAEIALNIDPEIIGVNNRDLKTFKTDLAQFAKLSKLIPKEKILIAESGISKQSDIDFVKENGANGVLIGTTFMRSQSIKEKFNELFLNEN